MMEHGFSLVLPSNSSPELFPENVISHFKVKVAKPINLSSDSWFVGLREISFPQSWSNVQHGWIQIDYGDTGRIVKFQLKSGYYHNASVLLDQIHQVFVNGHVETKVTVYHDNITDRIMVRVVDEQLRICFSQQICNLLGFDTGPDKKFDHGVHTGERMIDMMEGFSSLYVYSNLVQNRRVGDSLVPLLRHVPFDSSKRRKHHWVQFRHIEYLPIASCNTDVIEIDIRRDDGSRVSFETGKVVVTLHFIQRI